MLLDEPSQGLAPLVVRELADVIRRLPGEGVTVLLIEQNMRLAEVVADELHIMVKGRMVYSASPERFRWSLDANSAWTPRIAMVRVGVVLYCFVLMLCCRSISLF